MSDIIREVDEEIRREHWENLWKKYGKFVVGGAVAIVMVTAGIVGLRAFGEYRAEKAAERFATTLAQADAAGNAAAAADILQAFASDAPDGYAVLARFREAKLRADAGDKAAAIALYDSIAAGNEAKPMLRQLATFYSVRLQIDDGDPAALTARLKPLTAADSAWRYSAIELTAIIALASGDTEAARTGFATLADDLSAPDGLRARAAEMLRAIGP